MLVVAENARTKVSANALTFFLCACLCAGLSMPLYGCSHGADGLTSETDGNSEVDLLVPNIPVDEYCHERGEEYLQWVDAVDKAVADDATELGDGMQLSSLLDADDDLYASLKARLVQGAGPRIKERIVSDYGEEFFEALKKADEGSIAEGMREYLIAFTGVESIDDSTRASEVREQIEETIQALVGDR